MKKNLLVAGLGILWIVVGCFLAGNGAVIRGGISIGFGVLIVLTVLCIIISDKMAQKEIDKKQVHFYGLYHGDPVIVKFKEDCGEPVFCIIEDKVNNEVREVWSRVNYICSALEKEVREIAKDKNATTRAVVGAAIAGTAGAVIGAVSAQKKDTETVRHNTVILDTKFYGMLEFTECSNVYTVIKFMEQFDAVESHQ